MDSLSILSHIHNTNYSTRFFIDIRYGRLVIEIGRIRLSMDTRLPRRRDFLSFQSFPIDSRKERMLFTYMTIPHPSLLLLRRLVLLPVVFEGFDREGK